MMGPWRFRDEEVIAKAEAERGLASFQKEERGPGGWPTDPQIAFMEAHYKLDEARKEAARWRSNHANVARRLQHLEGDGPRSASARSPSHDGPNPANWRLNVSDRHIELYAELSRKPRAITGDEARMLVELVDAWRDLEHGKHLALKQLMPAESSDTGVSQ
jgi:hypothetical protein